MADAMEAAIRPRLAKGGNVSQDDEKALQMFSNACLKTSTKEGAELVFMWSPGKEEDVLSVYSVENEKWNQMAHIKSTELCHALFNTYLDDNSVIPGAREKFESGWNSYVN
eukprot:g2461.t1